MPTVSLKAHYDGKSILLDEPFQIPTHSELMVTILAPHPEKKEDESLAISSLARAYGDNEPEYSRTDIK